MIVLLRTVIAGVDWMPPPAALLPAPVAVALLPATVLPLKAGAPAATNRPPPMAPLPSFAVAWLPEKVTPLIVTVAPLFM